MSLPPEDYDRMLEAEVLHWKKLAADAEKVWRRKSAIGRRRFDRRVKYVSAPLKPGDRCLEAGCGVGQITEGLVQTGAEITAIDVSPDLLAYARRRVASAHFIEADICRTGLADATFDAVVGCSVLHHLDLSRALPEFFRLLKPGGWLRFTEPNYMNPHIVLERKVPWLREWLGVTRYETAFFRGSLAARLRGAGFSEVTVQPFDFLYPFFPDTCLKPLIVFERMLEKTPLIREFAGSLFIEARRPA